MIPWIRSLFTTPTPGNFQASTETSEMALFGQEYATTPVQILSDYYLEEMVKDGTVRPKNLAKLLE